MEFSLSCGFGELHANVFFFHWCCVDYTQDLNHRVNMLLKCGLDHGHSYCVFWRTFNAWLYLHGVMWYSPLNHG